MYAQKLSPYCFVSTSSQCRHERENSCCEHRSFYGLETQWLTQSPACTIGRHGGGESMSSLENHWYISGVLLKTVQLDISVNISYHNCQIHLTFDCLVFKVGDGRVRIVQSLILKMKNVDLVFLNAGSVRMKWNGSVLLMALFLGPLALNLKTRCKMTTHKIITRYLRAYNNTFNLRHPRYRTSFSFFIFPYLISIGYLGHIASQLVSTSKRGS